jgi:HSP20 family protein
LLGRNGVRMARKNADEQNMLQDEFLQDDAAAGGDWLGEEMEDYEGQLAVDVYQTKENVVIKAPIAGVTAENLDISISEEVVTIRGERVEEKEVDREHYYVQECYWGSFSRSVILPTSTVAEKANASLKDGVLTITIPKLAQDKVKKIRVRSA